MSHIVRVETRRSTKKFDKRRPLPRSSSEEESDAPEGTSGSTTCSSQQHSKKNSTTASPTACSTTTEKQVQEREASPQEQIKALSTFGEFLAENSSYPSIHPLLRFPPKLLTCILLIGVAAHATGTRDQRGRGTAPAPRDTFLGFLKNELLKIPDNVWFNYTIAAMTMAHNFSQPNLLQMGYMGRALQQMGRALMGPPQQMGQALMGPPQQMGQALMGPPQQMPLMGPPQQMPLMGPPQQMGQALMGPPQQMGQALMGPPQQMGQALMGPPQQMPLMGPPQQMPLMGPPQQQAHQPQSLMGPPLMPPPVMPYCRQATTLPSHI
ncbi:uncharacterized protein LOC144601573 [Rhinoraja longicauda]